MLANSGSLIREARTRKGVSQVTLARRASTTQKQVSRIESGAVSPSVSTLTRLLAALGERLELHAVPGPRDNRSDDDLRADFASLTASERVAQTAALSRVLTAVAHRPAAAVTSDGAGPLQAEALLRLLADHDVDFVVIGAIALAVHGVIRGTKDVDILPDPAPENAKRLAAALRALDSQSMRADDVGGNRVLRTRLGRLDVMQDVPGTRGFAALSAGAVERDVPGAGPFWFSGLDDLIAMKVAAARPQDELDVTSLQRARGD